MSACSHIYRKQNDGDMGYVPLQRPLSRWARLWLTLAARASCNSVEAVSRSSEGKEEEMARDPILMTNYLRALGETGELNRLVAAFASMLPSTQRTSLSDRARIDSCGTRFTRPCSASSRAPAFW